MSAHDSATLPSLIPLTVVRFARKHDCEADLLRELPDDLLSRLRRGERAHWDDVAQLFTRLDAVLHGDMARFAEHYVHEFPVVTLVASYIISSRALYGIAIHAWTRIWPMLHFEVEKLKTGFTLSARIEPPDRECEALLRLCTEILRRLPRVVGEPDVPVVATSLSPRMAEWAVALAVDLDEDDEPRPEELFSTVRQQVFSPHVVGTRVPSRWRLTPTETRIVLALAEGTSVHDIARSLGVTHETARTHLKRAMAKAGVHRQAELVRHLLAPDA